MSVQTLPERTDTGSGDGDFDHFYCCDPDLSRCGLDISGVHDAGAVDGPSPEQCPVCVAAWESCEPCPAAKCPQRKRGWWPW